MTNPADVLQGSYVYLLVFQIIVVASLMLGLIWLVVRRIRDRGGEEIEKAPVISAPNTEMLELASRQKEKIRALEGELERLNETGTDVKDLSKKNDGLQEKVKFLEQKLMEYEILQEEIGALSYLKIENQKLKEQILGRQAKGQEPIAQAATEAVPTPAPAAETPVASTAPADQLINALGGLSDKAANNSLEAHMGNLLGELDKLGVTKGQKQEKNP